MILRKISNRSIVVSLLRYFYKWYDHVKQKLTYIYHNSQIYNLVKGCRKKIKIYFRYSYLGRITETKQTTTRVFDSSLVVKYLINFLKRWKDKVTRYFRTSLAIIQAKNTKEQLNLSPVKGISIIAVAVITANVILSIVLQKQIGLWSWLIRGLFFFVAVSGLFCKANWATIKRSSVFLRKMRMD